MFFCMTCREEDGGKLVKDEWFCQRYTEFKAGDINDQKMYISHRAAGLKGRNKSKKKSIHNTQACLAVIALV